jgi:hypothetical protein
MIPSSSGNKRFFQVSLHDAILEIYTHESQNTRAKTRNKIISNIK